MGAAGADLQARSRQRFGTLRICPTENTGTNISLQILEIYYLKAGYIPGEQVAAHARRRFRLVPAQQNPNVPQPDVSLFLVHYGPSEPNDRVPINMIPYDERVNAIMQQRHFLQRAGQIRRKEFMLSDRVNWPSLPELTRQQMAPQPTPRGVPQQMAYPPQPAPGPPAKRARHAQNQSQHAAMPGGAAGEAVDDDEDISRGDMFDHLTPREISLGRYQQNHEWMEEILSSPYRMGQISPADLGLGLKGELASLTEGIFAAQGGDAFMALPEKSYVGKLDPDQAEEFRKRVDGYIKSTQSDIEKMEEEHKAKLAKFKEGSFIKTKERELKAVAEATGPEVWRIEGRVQSTDNDNSHKGGVKQSVDEIVGQVESSVGRKIEGKPRVARIQDGGFQEPAPEPEPEPEPEPVAAEPTAEAGEGQMSRQASHAGSQRSNMMEADMDMGDTAAGLLDQMHTGFSSNSTPVNNFPTPQAQLSAGQSNAATPSNVNNPSPGPAAPAQASADVDMGGTETSVKEEDAAPAAHAAAAPEAAPAPVSAPVPAPAPTATADEQTPDGDWVVVPKEGATADPNAGTSATPKATPGEESKPVGLATKASSAAATPAVTDGGSAAFDQGDAFSSLGDLDTAGDALSGFDAPEMDGAAGELGEGLDLQMDMEDSAFGDAFDGMNASGTPGEGNNQEM